MTSEPKEKVWIPIETRDIFSSNFYGGIIFLPQMAASKTSFQEMLISIHFPLNWMQSKPLTEWNCQLCPSGKLPMETGQLSKDSWPLITVNTQWDDAILQQSSWWRTRGLRPVYAPTEEWRVFFLDIILYSINTTRYAAQLCLSQECSQRARFSFPLRHYEGTVL